MTSYKKSDKDVFSLARFCCGCMGITHTLLWAGGVLGVIQHNRNLISIVRLRGNCTIFVMGGGLFLVQSSTIKISF